MFFDPLHVFFSVCSSISTIVRDFCLELSSAWSFFSLSRNPQSQSVHLFSVNFCCSLYGKYIVYLQYRLSSLKLSECNVNKNKPAIFHLSLCAFPSKRVLQRNKNPLFDSVGRLIVYLCECARTFQANRARMWRTDRSKVRCTSFGCSV